MPAYKNNHLVPKCVIKQWAVGESGKRGVYVYDSKKANAHFSTAEGRSAFSFAVEPNFYIRKVNNERIVKVERWLGAIENTLSRFIDKISNNAADTLLRDEIEYNKLLLALFSLKNRDKYTLSKVKEYLQNNPDKKKLIEVQEERDIDIAVLENLINLTTHEASLFGYSEVVVCRNKSGNLILGERPFLHEVFDGYSFITLSPFFFIGLKQTKTAPLYFYTDAMSEQGEQLNQAVAQNSRGWLVATTNENLLKYIPRFLEPKNESDPFYQPIQSLLHGYKIT